MPDIPANLRRVDNIDPSVVFKDNEGKTLFVLCEADGNARPRKGEGVQVGDQDYVVYRVDWKLTDLGLRQYVLLDLIKV